LKKILIIRFSSLGDIILTTPLLHILKKKCPDCQIDFLTKEAYAEVLKNNPNVSNTITATNELPFSELKSIKKRLKDYDVIIDLHNNLRTFYLKLFSGKKKFTFKKYTFRKRILVRFKINLLKNIPPVIDRYLLTIEDFVNVHHELGKQVPEIFIDENAKKKVGDLFKEFKIDTNKKLICIVPSSKHFTKTFPPDLYAEFIDRFDKGKYNFVLIGTGNDIHNIDIIKTGTGENVYNLYERLGLIELAELMKRCEVVITGDTGPMHIAEAVGTPIIMIAGSSVKEFGFYPQSKNAEILEVNNLKCRPCSHIGRNECPLEHFKCMREIQLQMTNVK
jgi:lipopolysaccharide heptosyltransferase II